jgi:hypothetical protein
MRRRYLNINIKLKRHPRSVRFTVGQGGASSAEGAKDFKRICLVLSTISANCLSVWGLCVSDGIKRVSYVAIKRVHTF